LIRIARSAQVASAPGVAAAPGRKRLAQLVARAADAPGQKVQAAAARLVGHVAQFDLQHRVRQRAGSERALCGGVGLEPHRAQLGMALVRVGEQAVESRAERGRLGVQRRDRTKRQQRRRCAGYART
jgi:hypothetical protein